LGLLAAGRRIDGVSHLLLLQKYPLARKLKPTELVMSPGDVLIFPKDTCHQTKTLTVRWERTENLRGFAGLEWLDWTLHRHGSGLSMHGADTNRHIRRMHTYILDIE